MALFRIFRKKKHTEKDPLEQKLDIISDLTRGLGRKELNSLLDAVKSMYDTRQKLLNVKTEDEKEMEPIDKAEKVLAKESEKKSKSPMGFYLKEEKEVKE